MHTHSATFTSFGINSLAVAMLALPIASAAQTTSAAAPPSASPAGQAIAIVSDADLGFGAPQAGLHTIYVKDSTGNLTPVTECACPSQPSLSLSGTRVVFRVAGPDGTSGAYYKDAPFTGQPVRIDVDHAGAAVAGGALSSNPVLSGNGQFVVFSSTADLDGAIGEIPGTADLFLRDLSAGRTERFTVGAQLTGNPSISADGRYVAFATPSQLLAGDVNNLGDVYLIDRARPESALRLLTEPALNVAARDATISAGGSAVVFTSAADSVVAGDSNGLADVFVVDLRAGTTTRVSVAPDVTGQDAASTFLSISGNGRRIAFAAAGNVFVRDLTSGETWPVSSSPDQAFGLAPDGRTVVASSRLSSVDVVASQLPPDLPIGAGVRGDPFDPVVGQNPVTLVFSSVTAPGNVDLSIRSGGPALPAGLSTATSYFVLSSSATTTGGALVCVNDMSGDTTALKLMHLEGGAWEDITTLAQTAGPAICGQAASLGTFVVATPVSEADPSTPSKDKKQAGVLNVVSWNVDASGFWDDAANWSGGVVPGNGDTVTIDRPAGNFVITVRTPTANVASLTANEQVTVTSVLTFAGTGSFNGGLILFGNLTGTGTAVLNSNSVWQANSDTIISLAGGVDVQATRTLTITATGNQTHYLDAAPLRNHGTVLWNSGPLLIRNGTAVVNDFGKIWEVQGDLVLQSDGSGTPTFTNAGIFQRTAGAGDLNITGSSSFAFTNNGTLDLQTGTFNVFAGSLTNSGLMQVGAGATFRLDRVTLLGSSTFAGTGTLHANGTTTITGDVAVTATLLITSNVTGTGPLRLAGATTWQANGDTIISVAGGVDVQPGKTLTISATGNQTHYLDAAPLRNHGTVVWNSGPLVIRNGTAVVNDAGKIWEVQGDLVLQSDGSGTPTFTNAGIFRRTAGAGDLNITGSSSFAFTNNGTLDLQTGTFNVFAGSLTNSGLVQVGAGTTFRLDRVTFLGTSTFAGTGTLHANGITTITGDVTVTAPLLITSNVTGTGPLRLGAATTWQANGDTIISVAGGVDVQPTKILTITATGNQTHYLDAAPLRNHGTVVWNSGPLVIRNGTSVVNDAGKIWNVQGDLVLQSDGSGIPTFTNAGIFQRTAGAGDLNITGSSSFIFTNNGTFDLQTGTFNVFAGSLTNSGLVQLGAGTTFRLDRVTLLSTSTFAGTGTLHANGATTITGDVTVTAPLLITSTLTGTGPLRLGAATTWQANGDTIISVAGGIDVQPGKTLTISASGNQAHYLDAAPLRNHGTVVWNSGPLVIRNGTSVVNDAGKIWDVQGDLVLLSDGSGIPTFSNAGIFRRTAGAGDLNITGSSSFAFTNNGTFDLQTGTFNVFAGSLTNSGLMQVGAGTTFRLDHVTLLSSSTFAGTGTLHANGTTTITGDVTVTAPLLITSNVTGTGPLRLGAATTWQANGDTIIGVAGGVDVQPGKTLTISASGNQTHYLIDSPLRNHGTVLWTGGPLVLRNTSTATNDIGGLWEVQSSVTMVYDGTGSPVFVNQGTLRRSGAPNRLTVTPPFTNMGIFDVRIGGAGGGQLDEFGGNAVNLGGTLSVHLINGLTPGPSDQFKVIDYGSLSGAFATLTGDGFTFETCGAPNALFVCNVATTKLTPTITWNNPADIFFGTALSATQLNATASVPGTFVYSPGAGTPLNAGNNQLLQVTFTPTDTAHYNNATASVHINVLRATPIITWVNPAAIGYGTALSATQLNATANTAGAFVYSPAAGVKLHAGNNQVLSTTFTPTDTANFQTANASVMINVSRAALSVTAANATKPFGAALPPFTANFSGFVNSDTPANLTGTLVLSTSGTATSPAGLYSIVPSGLSSTDYIITFLPGTLTITRAITTTTLQVLPGTTGYLQVNVLIANVVRAIPGAGTPHGTVQFRDGATLIGSAVISGSQAFILANGLASGTHSLTAVYVGSANFAVSSSSPGTATVRPLANSTFTSLTAPRQAVGLPATLTAKVTPLGGGTPTGTVQFSEGSTILGSASVAGGVATLNTTALGVGTHLLKAKYSGNATLAQSTSPPAAITIYAGARPPATAVALAASPSPSTLGQPVIFTATVAGGASTGSVSFYADGLLIGSASLANVGGSFKATLTLTTGVLSLGTHVLSASYLGSAGFASSSSPLSLLTVQASPSLSEEATPSVDEMTMPSVDEALSLIEVQ